ncbi:MAG: adenylate/guanylate cyclase domain-containing protein [Cyanobacteriota bacterium]
MKSNKKQEKKKKYFQYSIYCGILSTAISFILLYCLNLAIPGIIDKANGVWLDSLFRTRQSFFSGDSTKFVSDNIVLVLFNDSTDKKLGKFWPYPRSETAKVIEYLKYAGAKSIMFDIMYQVPKKDTKSDIDNDKFLVKSTQEAGNVYLGVKHTPLAKDFNPDPALLEKSSIDIKLVNDQPLITFDFNDDKRIITPPFKKLWEVSKGIGFLNSNQDSDGVKRTNDLIFCNQNKCYPSLSLSCFLDLNNTKQIILNPGKYFEINKIKIPVTSDNKVYINWLGGTSDLSKLTTSINKFVAKSKLTEDQLKEINDIITLQIYKNYKKADIKDYYNTFADNYPDFKKMSKSINLDIDLSNSDSKIIDTFFLDSLNKLKDISGYNNKEWNELVTLISKKALLTNFIYNKKSAWKLLSDYDTILNYKKDNNLSDEEISKIIKSIPGTILDPDFFKDKLVLVGVTSKGAEDFIGSPFDRIPGVYNHAYVLDSLISNNFIKPLNIGFTVLIVILFSFITSLAVFLAVSKDSITSALYPIISIILAIFISIWLFGSFNIALFISNLLIGIIISTLLSVAIYSMTEGKNKKQIKAAMANYLSPEVLKAVMDDPEQLSSEKSRRKELTILFSDIRGFTTFSENNPAEIVVRMLNEYLFNMTTIIFNNNGTLDKFIGDAIMAFWGAPIDEKDHALLAVKTALEMKDKVKELNYDWEKIYKHKVHIGIGINTEEVVVGNIGSEKFMDYTVIGDGVNLASRLEGLNKKYGTTIIIGENTYRLVKDHVNVRHLGSEKVKGKVEDTEIYELIGFKVSNIIETEGDFS